MPSRFLGVGKLAEFVANMRRSDMQRDVVPAVVHEERRTARRKLVRMSAGRQRDTKAHPTWNGMMVQLRAVVRIGELLLMASARPGNGTKYGTDEEDG